MASRVPVSTLNSVDLPTFGRPTRAIMGNMAALTARGTPLAGLRGHRLARRGRHPERFHAIGVDDTAVVDDDHHIAHYQRLGADACSAGRDPRRECAARLVEP